MILINDCVHSLRTPAMFRGDMLAIFTNLLTNALKAAGTDGVVRALTELDDDLHIRFENTGVEVDLADAERWFRPFESTTLEVEPVLGQGMGLGLTITRDLLSEIGATISFVKPRRGFATAIEITFSGGRLMKDPLPLVLHVDDSPRGTRTDGETVWRTLVACE